ncbi:MAG: hybrid sensor histidine kinase/response regulator [Bacteroidia bacterium]|nr:MAG: hybrid sensor histidine kinase/response regulator [Bacteroidia bacterium]
MPLKYPHRILIALIIIIVSISASGQEKELLFSHFFTDDGLSHNSVYAINQDTLGFVWIGTRSGLNRFDGNVFKTYDLNQGLKDVYINSIFRDSEGEIWIGTQEGGLSRYNYLSDSFDSWLISLDDQASLRRNNVLSVAEDNHGRIWVGSHAGELNIFSKQNLSFEKVEIINETYGDGQPDRINQIYFDSDSTAWLGTFHGLYQLWIPDLNKPATVIINRVLNNWVTSIFRNSDGRLWVGTNSGIFLGNYHDEEFELINTSNSNLSNNMVTDIESFNDGTIIIGTDGGGINIYNVSTGQIEVSDSDPNNQYSLSNNSVYDIFVDRDRSIWVGNYIGGLNYYSSNDWKFTPVRHKLNNPRSLSDNHVRTFCEDSQGNIWMGTLGGLNLYDRKTLAFSSYTFSRSSQNSLSSNTVLSIFEAGENYLWIGTFGGGLNIFDKSQNLFTKFSHPDDQNRSLDRASIYQIADAGKGRIILATLGGIYLVDTVSGRMTRYTSSNSSLSSNTVKALCRDSHGYIWLGTNFGLNRFNPDDGSFVLYIHSTSDPNSLSNNRVLSIVESGDGLIWIGTEGGGVSIFDHLTGKFSAITINEGLSDNVVNAVLQDNNGSYWLSTNKGLVRYNISNEVFSIYTVADGLQGNEFYQNSSLKASDGSLFFGGPYGFNNFDPQLLKISPVPPVIIFTDLSISGRIVRDFNEKSPLNKQLCLQELLRFPYHSSFEIHFSVPGSPNSNKYQFAYFLEGAGEDWTEFQKAQSANFSNLRPGNYTFFVRAINNDGIISDNLASIRIKILPPWWKTWWVFIIYSFIIGGLLLVLLHLNNSKIIARHELQNEVREREQLESLNQMKLSFFTDISHEFKTPLTLILGHLDNLRTTATHGKGKTLLIIESNARRLLLLINQLLEFRKAESGLMRLNASKGNIMALINTIKESFSDLALRKRIDLKIVAEEPVPDLWFDSEKMEKIVFNILSNAFKYTNEGGSILVEIGKDNHPDERARRGETEYLQIRFMDSGRGIARDEIDYIFDRFNNPVPSTGNSPKPEGSGIGLAFSKRLVELHHGKISVKSEEGKGAEFIISFPLGKDHLADSEIKGDNEYHLKLDYHSIENDSRFDGNDIVNIVPNKRSKPIMLIVDDNPAVCQVITEKFHSGFTVISASDGKAGIQKARLYLPDIVISDIMMPYLDGFEFCNLVKTNMSTSHIPVILLTAKSGEEDQIHGYTTGADAYIAKPYNPELLRATVDNLMNSRKILRKKYIDQANNIPSELFENKLDEEFLRKLVETIESEKFSENLDVATLCNELGMSRSVLYRKIKMLTDNSIQEFVRIVKLRKAARLLLSAGNPISDIAFVSGFSNTKHFSTAFKKLYGKTPSQYRNTTLPE